MDNNLKRGAEIAGAIREWLLWASDSHGEEFAYISDDLVEDMANYIHIRAEV